MNIGSDAYGLAVAAEEERAFAAWREAWQTSERLRREAVVTGTARAWQEWEQACATGGRLRQTWAAAERARRSYVMQRQGLHAADE